MTCGKCMLLRVLPDADGKVRVRKGRAYSCTAKVENLRLPKSVRRYDPPVPSYMEPTEGEGCSYFVEKASPLPRPPLKHPGEIVMKRWMVETRAIVSRTYFVDAEDEKAAEAASCNMDADLDEEENEETMSISEVPTTDEPSPQEGAVRHD